MTHDQRDAWNAFKYIVEHFLGNRISHDFEVRVECLMRSYIKLEFECPLKCIFTIRIWITFLTIVEITVSFY